MSAHQTNRQATFARVILDQSHRVQSMTSFAEDVAFRESYIYSDQNDLEWEYGQSTLGTLPSPSNKGDDESFVVMSHSTPSRGEPIHNKNRLSIVSTSTMTSGIVSDKTCISTENSQGMYAFTAKCGIELKAVHVLYIFEKLLCRRSSIQFNKTVELWLITCA